MKKLIVMLVAWAAICLLSLPETETNNGAKEEIALADTELPSEKISQPVLKKLP